MNTSLGNYDYIENCIGLYCKGYDCMSLQLYHVYRNRIKIFGSRCRGTNKKMATWNDDMKHACIVKQMKNQAE